MRLSEFDFTIPEDLIAQRPLEQRGASRMLVLHRSSGKVEHRFFAELPEFLAKPDHLVLNRSRVIKARLIGQRESGGKVEIFLLRKLGDGKFECLVKATAASKEGLEVSFGGGVMRATIVRKLPDGITYEAELAAEDGRLEFWIEKFGRIPLPPYIRRDADGLDVGRYQTIYAAEPGSVAAPTAGLHFTEEMFTSLEAKGVSPEYVTLHVGLGTFQPIKVEDLEHHVMHEEHFHVEEKLWNELNGARKKGERVVAVGTTTVRALESRARGMTESTSLFLRPGSQFQVVDAMLTNFHQPKSSLMVMMAAFVGSRELLLEAYAKAVEEKYRFFSYGDCMLVIS